MNTSLALQGKSQPSSTVTEIEERTGTHTARGNFWDLVVKMVNRGRLANELIDVIYSYYGFKQSFRSSIIRQLQKERMEGTGYPQLL